MCVLNDETYVAKDDLGKFTCFVIWVTCSLNEIIKLHLLQDFCVTLLDRKNLSFVTHILVRELNNLEEKGYKLVDAIVVEHRIVRIITGFCPAICIRNESNVARLEVCEVLWSHLVFRR